jgi:hypothetical protein
MCHVSGTCASRKSLDRKSVFKLSEVRWNAAALPLIEGKLSLLIRFNLM